MIFERYESAPVFFTCITSDPFWLIDPAMTVSFFCLKTDFDSPVSIDWSICACPSMMVPSAGIFSPGLTKILSFSLISESFFEEIVPSGVRYETVDGRSSESFFIDSFDFIVERISSQWPRSMMSISVATSQKKVLPGMIFKSVATL